MKVKKWFGSALAVGLMSTSLLTACGSNNNDQSSPSASAPASGNASETPAASSSNGKPVKLKFAMWETDTDIKFWTEKVKEYTAQKPNVTIEVETVPDNSGQYLKVRLAANDLPDLFMMKPNHLPIYKENLLPVGDLQATANNKYPGTLGDQVLGLPLVSFSEYVYYHPSIFQEAGVEVPKTFDEFMAAMEKIKAGGKYIPLAIGGKDDWTFYPISEFGPQVLSKDSNYLVNLATTPEPFGTGSTFDKVANMVKTIAKDDLAGPDALAIGYDQATDLFRAKKAAMIALGQWYYADHLGKAGNDDDLAAFPLPWRATADEPLTSLTMADQYIGINKDSKNVEEAKAFYEWMFSKDVYQAYIDVKLNTSTVKDVTANLPFFVKADSEHPFTPFFVNSSDERFAKVKAAAQYDEKKTAADIFAGAKVEDVEKKLNANWKKAVESVK
ncbi:ABC transporter substrate-binding protein [Cohnella soli]|uniref:ABC transporter substrate-binding protein n=1 Tax=Cohnella soli TaxID=425005 RepID=A0ABW0HMC9_9BACL